MLSFNWSIYSILKFMKTLKNPLWKSIILKLMVFHKKFSFQVWTNNTLNLPMNNKEQLSMKNQSSTNIRSDCWMRWYKHSRQIQNQVKKDSLTFMILSTKILKLWTILKLELNWFLNIWTKKKSNTLMTIIQNLSLKSRIEKPWSYGKLSLSNLTQKAKLKILELMLANFAKELELWVRMFRHSLAFSLLKSFHIQRLIVFLNR